ncbi:histidine kinase [Microbacterium sp. STN6]|uniref:sensor histidine kinase n=1 Tax=Microbacterium sp. STN6 TaxID=2995588 RepID=UPI002260C7C0|nr:histidine kinase [Microbacterium sp. STN6]MCX7522688.1 histidine kinase [Microbacterium sp. STN6]
MVAAILREHGARVRPAVEDAAVALVVTVLALVPLGVPALELGGLKGHASGWAVVALSLAQTVPLLLRRRAPAVALVIIGAGFAAAQLLGADTGLAGLGVLVALYSCGRHQRRMRWQSVAVGTVAYALLALGLVAAGSPERPLDWVTFWVVLAAPWCAGAAVRTQRDRQEEHERLLARQAVADARTAIVRDLHDVVTHHVTAMVVQAESTVFATENLAADERSAALASIGVSGRAALQDLRALLDALDPAHLGGEPREAASVAGLVARLAATGYPITVEGAALADADAASAAVLHDVAREAVTNAMKHAPGMPVRLVLRAVEGGAAVELSVQNAVPGDALGSAVGGRGLSIMSERVSEAGGTFDAGPTADGTYRATACLPIPVGTRDAEEAPDA